MDAMKVIGTAIVTSSWLMFLASFFLPATNVLEAAGTAPGTPLTGWQAFVTSISAGSFNPWAWLGDWRVMAFLIFPVTNAVMFVAPAFGVLGKGSFVPALLLLPAAVVPWLLPHELRGDLYVGFYLWNASYVVASVGCCLLAIGSHENARGNGGI